MSTRAVYTFKDEYDTIHVYKHHDGYPEGGLSWIANARNYAWPFPRFEASDFAAAFVAANKPRFDPKDKYPTSGGGVRLARTGITEPWQLAPDAEYHYIVTWENGGLQVEILSVGWWDMPEKSRSTEQLFKGSLEKAILEFKAEWVEPLENHRSA